MKSAAKWAGLTFIPALCAALSPYAIAQGVLTFDPPTQTNYKPLAVTLTVIAGDGSGKLFETTPTITFQPNVVKATGITPSLDKKSVAALFTFLDSNATGTVIVTVVDGTSTYTQNFDLGQGVLTITPPGRTDNQPVPVTLSITAPNGTAKDFGNAPVLSFLPDLIKAPALTVSADKKTATTTFTVGKNATGIIAVTLKDGGNVYAGSFDTGVVCIESLKTGGCLIRWEVITSSATGSSSMTNKNTSPNILVKLDLQFRSPTMGKGAKLDKSKAAAGTQAMLAPVKDQAKAPRGPKDRFSAHAIFQTGYTQAPITSNLTPVSMASAVAPATPAANVRPAATSSGSTPAASTTCPSTSPTSSCMAVAQQQAFIGDAKITFGWTFSQDGKGLFSEFGVAGRGSIQDILQSNQVLNSGNIQYVNLASANMKTTSGLWEGVARFRLAAHDAPAANTGNGYKHNSSDLLLLEAGYQNNSGLQQLAANPNVNTRDRYILRFSAFPEIPGTSHTKALVGMEYSGGINGGAKVVQLFFGGNFNPAKLFAAAQNAASGK